MQTTSHIAQSAGNEFLEASRVCLMQDYLPRLVRCLEAMPEGDIWWRPNEASNSVGNLLLHLRGNMQDWIVTALGGGTFKRDRDAEFTAAATVPRSQLIAMIRSTMEEVDGVLAHFPEERLLELKAIQRYEPSALQAIYHVVEHFSYHLGQILYIYKLRTGLDLGFYRQLSRE